MAGLRKLHAAFICGSGMKFLNRKWLLVLPIGVLGATGAVLGALNPGMEAQTSPENPDARLRTRRYKVAIGDVRRSTLEIIPKLWKYGSHWRVIESESENVVVAEVPVLVFIDELRVTLTAENDFTRVDIYSKSRFPGGSDLGENRRHVLQLLAALDEKFTG